MGTSSSESAVLKPAPRSLTVCHSAQLSLTPTPRSSSSPHPVCSDAWSTIVNNRSRASWVVAPQPDGSVILRSRAPGFKGWHVGSLRVENVASARTCGIPAGTQTNNMRVYNPATSAVPPQRFFLSDPLQSLNAMPSTITFSYRSERVVVEALGGPSSALASCGGSLIAQNVLGLQNPAGGFTLAPPLACRAVCGPSSFSLLAGGSGRYVFATASGSLKVGYPSEPEFTPEGASFVATRVTVDGVSGWTLAPASGVATGLVLTRGAPGSCPAAHAGCCVEATSPVAVTASAPSAGLTRDHVFRIFWEDGAGEVTALPSSDFAAPACAASGTPVASTSPTPSKTSSNTPSSSTTGSNTPSASQTQVLSFSATPSPDSATATPSSSTTATVSATPSATSTATPSGTPYYRVAGRLWIDLAASDFAIDPSTGVPAWDNKVSPGAVSGTNGDFVGATGVNASLTWPSFASVGSPAVPAVVFNVSADGVADRLSSAHAYWPGSGSFFTQSDWSLEGWVMVDDASALPGASENAWFQWSTRPGLTCNVANIGVSHNPGYGAGGHWGGGCDISYSGPMGNAATEQIAGSGWMPRRGQWHHIVITVSGMRGTVVT